MLVAAFAINGMGRNACIPVREFPSVSVQAAGTLCQRFCLPFAALRVCPLSLCSCILGPHRAGHQAVLWPRLAQGGGSWGLAPMLPGPCMCHSTTDKHVCARRAPTRFAVCLRLRVFA